MIRETLHPDAHGRGHLGVLGRVAGSSASGGSRASEPPPSGMRSRKSPRCASHQRRHLRLPPQLRPSSRRLRARSLSAHSGPSSRWLILHCVVPAMKASARSNEGSAEQVRAGVERLLAVGHVPLAQRPALARGVTATIVRVALLSPQTISPPSAKLDPAVFSYVPSKLLTGSALIRSCFLWHFYRLI